MIKSLLSASLIGIVTLVGGSPSIGEFPGLVDRDDTDIDDSTLAGDAFSFEIVEGGPFGPYDLDYTNNDFEVVVEAGYAYRNTTFRCYSTIFYTLDYSPSGWGIYPDLEMGEYYITFGDISNVTGKDRQTAKFHTTFFGWYNVSYNWADITLVFNFEQGYWDTSGNWVSQVDTPIYFSASAVMRGCGKYELEKGTTSFTPIDNYFVFVSDNEEGNITETVDFSNCSDAICESKYLSLSEHFGFSFTPKSMDILYDTNTDIFKGYIYVKDPQRYFKYMHEGSNDYFVIPLKVSDHTTNISKDKDGNLMPQHYTFKVGGETYWVEPNTLEMAREQITKNYKQTDNFYFKVGYYEEIKENCEFSFVATNVGYNEATYIIPIDFEGDHDYFGDCTSSNYCVSGGWGSH